MASVCLRPPPCEFTSMAMALTSSASESVLLASRLWSPALHLSPLSFTCKPPTNSSWQHNCDPRRPWSCFISKTTRPQVFMRRGLLFSRDPIRCPGVRAAKVLSASTSMLIDCAVLHVPSATASASDVDRLFIHLPMAAESMKKGMQMVNFALIDPGYAAVACKILGPFLAAFNLLFVLRIVMSWYPQLPVNKLPFVIAYAPTEPVLAPTRKLIPPVGGVDISPVIWLALVSFSNEILLGQQGLLVLLSQQQP